MYLEFRDGVTIQLRHVRLSDQVEFLCTSPPILLLGCFSVCVAVGFPSGRLATLACLSLNHISVVDFAVGVFLPPQVQGKKVQYVQTGLYVLCFHIPFDL